MRNSHVHLYYTSPGYLQGIYPRGVLVTVRHPELGVTRYELFWNGRWRRFFRQDDLVAVFGISPNSKKTGSQEGFPSEAVIRALWSHFVDRLNQRVHDVRYSAGQPSLGWHHDAMTQRGGPRRPFKTFPYNLDVRLAGWCWVQR